MWVKILSHSVAKIWYYDIKLVLEKLYKIPFPEKIEKEIIEIKEVISNILKYIWEDYDKNKKVKFNMLRSKKWIRDIGIDCESINYILWNIHTKELSDKIIILRREYLLIESQKKLFKSQKLIKEYPLNEIKDWNEKDRNEKIDILITLKEKWYFNEILFLTYVKNLFKNISFKWLSTEYDNKYWIISDHINRS